MWKPKAVTIVMTVTASAIFGAGAVGVFTSPTNASVAVTATPTQDMSDSVVDVLLDGKSSAGAALSGARLTDALRVHLRALTESELTHD